MINFFSVLSVITLVLWLASLTIGASYLVCDNARQGNKWLAYSFVPIAIFVISVAVLFIFESQAWWLQNGIIK